MAKQDFNSSPEILIFLDMDGVISDFDRHVIETGKVKEDGSPDYKAMNEEDWYTFMPAFEGAKDFYYDLKELGNVRFLTTPLTHPESFSGKARWILDFLSARSTWVLRSLMLVQDKELVSAPGRFLIDDRTSNIEKWENPGYGLQGGTGILHTGDYKDTLTRLKSAIKDFTQGVKNAPAAPNTQLQSSPPPQP